jgi:predicted NUDIX family phosphoesterase
MSEKVLCFKKDFMGGFTNLNGSITDVYDSNLYWLNHCYSNAEYLERSIVEGNPDYKQLIPYVVALNFSGKEPKVFSYTRAGSEDRLKDLISIGLGGHINPCDFSDSFITTVNNNVVRELCEELDLGEFEARDAISNRMSMVESIIYLSSDNDSTVNDDHLGIMLKVHLPSSVTMSSEGKDSKWRSLEELKSCNLEDWSRIALGIL